MHVATAEPGSFTAAGEGERWSLAALLSVLFLGVAAGIQMSDRGLQAILLPAIKQSFVVSDTMLGALQGLAGILVASAVAVPLARLADRVSRKRILIGLIAAWTGLTALSALAPDFPLFFVGRAASGVTEFAMIPIVYSLIPDLAPERHRVAANLSFAALMATGMSAGFYFGGALVGFATQVMPGGMEPWRDAMLLLALLGLPLMIAACFTLDPPRRALGEATAATVPLAGFLRERWRAVGLFVGVAGGLAIAVQALNGLIAMALQRRFGADLDTIGHALGLMTLATAIGCLPVAGLLDRLLRGRLGLAARPLIMGIGAVGAVPCALLLTAVGGTAAALALVTLFLFLTCTANALVPTMLQDLTPASLRARSFAVWSFVVSSFYALGPLVAGFLSDRAFGGDLLTAIAVTALPALCFSALCAARTVMREMRHQ